MGKQTIRIRRVGSVTFGLVLIATGVIFLAALFFPRLDYSLVLQFWPLILILLGVEVLFGCRQKNYEILDKEGKVLEQNRIVYDVPAILLTMALVLFSVIMAVVNLALISYRHIIIR
ncbi:MAG: DUF5668 domain-containing protein [Lachnospiraceae bacterium]|nr:DUF5668 domain-containing protein [Lachnospiraceae bacterium]